MGAVPGIEPATNPPRVNCNRNPTPALTSDPGGHGIVFECQGQLGAEGQCAGWYLRGYALDWDFRDKLFAGAQGGGGGGWGGGGGAKSWEGWA